MKYEIIKVLVGREQKMLELVAMTYCMPVCAVIIKTLTQIKMYFNIGKYNSVNWEVLATIVSSWDFGVYAKK